MRFKSIIFIILFIVFFLGEIAISFSFKRDSNRNIPSSDIIPLSQNLDNELSTYLETQDLDSIISDFISRNDIKGASVAITRKGKLIYAKGFGYADLATKEMVDPGSLFRIASVSKLITAVTVMKLVEDEKLNLNDKVFGNDGILNDPAYLNYTDRRIERITVENLLEHTAGWNNKNADPVFRSLSIANEMKVDPPASLETVIQYALKQRLDFAPGTKYSYSNLGYTILGQVIEKVTGMKYEDYVQFAILHPLGIYDMHIGRNYFTEKFANEVRYYEPERARKCYAFDGSGDLVPLSYGGNNIELLGAAGGWLASSAELSKLIVAIDGFDSKPDILSQHIIDIMTETNAGRNRLIGWRGSDGHGTWWRTGTLAGTSALVMRHRNEINWVVLLNTSTNKQSHIHNELSHTMFRALRSIEEWPEQDLFNRYSVNKTRYFAVNRAR